MQFRLGVFDPPSSSPYAGLGPEDVNTAASKVTQRGTGRACLTAVQQLALEAARQAVVLLQNNGNVLPLSASRYTNVAVVGPNANGTTLMLGNYYGQPETIVSPLAGIQSYVTADFVFVCSLL